MHPWQLNNNHHYYIINKPIQMVSQFVSPHNVGLLAHLGFEFPKGTHAVGRLDNNSEGLLILTTNKKVTSLLFSGNTKHKRVYLVQVNNQLSTLSLKQLGSGVPIRISGGENYITPSCEVEMVDNPESVYPFLNLSNQYGSSTWILITLYEGKFRQIRKMVAALHHHCKRLIRVRIEDLTLGDLKPGCVREIEENEFFKKLKIKSL